MGGIDVGKDKYGEDALCPFCRTWYYKCSSRRKDGSYKCIITSLPYDSPETNLYESKMIGSYICPAHGTRINIRSWCEDCHNAQQQETYKVQMVMNAESGRKGYRITKERVDGIDGELFKTMKKQQPSRLKKMKKKEPIIFEMWHSDFKAKPPDQIRQTKSGHYEIYVAGAWELWHHFTIWSSGEEIPHGYVVHHINRQKMDNRRENLAVITKHQHRLLHLYEDTIDINNRHKHQFPTPAERDEYHLLPDEIKLPYDQPAPETKPVSKLKRRKEVGQDPR